MSEKRQKRRVRGVATIASEKDAPRRVVHSVYRIVPAGTPALTPQEILGRMQRLVEPNSWTEPNVFGEVVGGDLIIHQTPNVQRQCRRMIRELGSVVDPRGRL